MCISLSSQGKLTANHDEIVVKRVSFRDLDDTRTIPSRSDLSAEDFISQWYSADDFSAFKLTARMISIQARQSGFSALLEHALHFDFSEDDPLIMWSRSGNLRRGLEQSVNPEHGETMREEKKRAKKNGNWLASDRGWLACRIGRGKLGWEIWACAPERFGQELQRFHLAYQRRRGRGR